MLGNLTGGKPRFVIYKLNFKIVGNIKEFIAHLGDQNDFVSYVRTLEQGKKLDDLANFYNTPGGKRYLSVRNGPTKIVDFRHFFAAMLLTSKGFNTYSAKPEGVSLLMGVGNELNQCTSEIYAGKINSCFSNEDLGSNRLGAAFGEILNISQSENRQESIASLLDRYLTKLHPLTTSEVSKLQINSNADIIRELIIAIIVGIKDAVISKAY